MPSNPPDGYHTITPYAVVPDPRAMVEFVEKALGGEPTDMFEDDDGRIIHTEVKLGDSVLMMGGSNDEFPPFPAMLHVYVEDVDAAYRAALDHGATSAQEPEDQFYGDRTAGVVDGQGNTWWLATRVEDVSPEEMQRRASAT